MVDRVEASEALIKKVSGEYDVEQVRYLSLEGYHLTSLTSVLGCLSLVELSLARNALGSAAGLGILVQLQRLDLSHNQIRRIDDLETLAKLRWLDLSANCISRVEDIGCLGQIAGLHTLFLRRPAINGASEAGGDERTNPACQHPAYPGSMFRMLPQLSLLDGAHLALVAAADALESRLQAIRPDLSALPADTLAAAASPWYSQADLHIDSIDVSQAAPAGYLAVEEAADAVGRLLDKACADNLRAADAQVSSLRC